MPMPPPRMVVYGNSNAEPYPSDVDEARGVLARQLSCTVRFEEMVRNLARRGVGTFVEVGAGGVLTGLVGECLAKQPHLAVALDRRNPPGLTGLWHCLGQPAVRGGLNWDTRWRDHPDLPPPEAHPARAVMIGGSSKGRRPGIAQVAPAEVPQTAADLERALPGVVAMLQWLQSYMLERNLHAGIRTPSSSRSPRDNRSVGSIVGSGLVRIELEVADAWLWVDGTRIDDAPGLALSVRSARAGMSDQPPLDVETPAQLVTSG